MSIFHHVEDRWAWRRFWGSETENRLPLGQSAIIILVLAVLSWALLIAIIIGLLARSYRRDTAYPVRRRMPVAPFASHGW